MYAFELSQCYIDRSVRNNEYSVVVAIYLVSVYYHILSVYISCLWRTQATALQKMIREKLFYCCYCYHNTLPKMERLAMIIFSSFCFHFENFSTVMMLLFKNQIVLVNNNNNKVEFTLYTEPLHNTQFTYLLFFIDTLKYSRKS